jgi:hypothetical protein
MKLNLLQLTQNILSSLDSDEVNSIGDTTESLQVATIIQTVFYNMVSRAGLPDQMQLFQLTPSNDETKPVLMFKPENVDKIDWLKYLDTNPNDSEQQDQFGSYSHDLNTDITTNPNDNTVSSPVYKYVTLLPVQQFLDMTNNFNLSEGNVDSFVFTEGPNSFTFYYKNDRQPMYATVVENFYFIFDSFDNSQDSTLQASKTLCSGQTIPVFVMEDTFIPDLDDYQFPLLLSESKSLAYFELKQTLHQKAEQENKRQWSQVQKNKSIDNRPSYFDQLPDFGRRAWSGSAGAWFHTFRNDRSK